jgi:hypothetical protein
VPFDSQKDNDAIGFFDKQGFTTEITTREDCWKGGIGEYSESTVMELRLS